MMLANVAKKAAASPESVRWQVIALGEDKDMLPPLHSLLLARQAHKDKALSLGVVHSAYILFGGGVGLHWKTYLLT